jgi:SH3-like domain-containing protein
LALVVSVHLLIIFIALMDYQTMDPASSKENVVESEVVKSESPCDGKDLTGKNREVVGDRVNLRVGPGTKFEKVTYVNPNDSDQELVARLESGMRVLEQCLSGDWARVMVDRPARYKESHQGWVAREYLR